MNTGSYSSHYEIVSPYYLESVAAEFLKESIPYTKLYVADLAQLYYADYDNSDMVDPYQSEQVQNKVLAMMAENRDLILDNAAMKYVQYASMVTDISRESSDYATFAMSIPFRQLVMNGLTEYTTENVNMSSQSMEYYILQAMELGSIPKFTIMGELEDVLKNSDYDYLYAVNFDKLETAIWAVYQECAKSWSLIGTNEIVHHRSLADKVFETEYGTGVRVIVNYNLTAVTLEDGTTLGAEDYVIISGEGELLK